MKEIKKNWTVYVAVLFGIVVFCFWNYVRPAQIAAREAFQLFLFQDDYLMYRLSVPGGMTRYVAEFLVQFFRSVSLGALITAILLVAIQWVSWKLLCRNLSAVSPLNLFPFSFLPSFALWKMLCDMDVSVTLPVAVLLTWLLMMLLPNKRRQSLVVSLVLIPIGYWLVGPIIICVLCCHLKWLQNSNDRIAVLAESAGLTILLAACVIVSSRVVPYSLWNMAKGIDYWMIQSDKAGTYEEIEYDYLQQQKQWGEIITLSEEEEPKSLACRNVVRLAKYYQKCISGEELKENMLHPNKVLTSGAAAMMMSDVYLHMGFVNMSQRAAFEVMMSSPNYNMSGRELSRLVETNLITGQYEVALKYISLLEHTLFYRNWAKQMRQLATNPELIKRSSKYGPLQEVYQQTVDVFFF